MSQEPTVTLKPIGLKLSTAPSTEGRQGQGKGKTGEYDNLCSGLTYNPSSKKKLGQKLNKNRMQ